MTPDAPGGLLASIDRQTQLAGHNRLALLLFRLHGPELYGINVFKVREVLPWRNLTWVPSAHPIVLGVADVRGTVIPVMDLARAIGARPGDGHGHLIVSEYNRSVQGFQVGAVDRIINVDVRTVRPPDASGAYLTAVTRHADRLVQIIDVEQVMADVIGGGAELSAGLAERARTEAQGGGKRVLVVDDSRVARNQVERLLHQLGLTCVLVNDGQQALEWLRGQAAQNALDDIALVVSDIEMPDMDGYTLTTEIRRDPALENLYVILHTSLSGVFNQAMVQRVGANRFIAKFSPDELATAVLERVEAVAA